MTDEKGGADVLAFENGAYGMDQRILTLSLPAGWTEPFARDNYTVISPDTGETFDGPSQRYVNFKAIQERNLEVRQLRWNNYIALQKCKDTSAMVKLITDSLPHSERVVINYSGDFYCKEYLEAWLEVARNRPSTTFYTQTTSLPYWVENIPNVPENMRIVALAGGKHDSMIRANKLRHCHVVFSEEEAMCLGLELDRNHRLLMTTNDSFATYVSGLQKPDSPAGKAVLALKTGYVDVTGMTPDAVVKSS